MATTIAEPVPEEEAAAPSAPPPRTHCCSACSFPVASYGRLWPCKHAFCLACATGHALCFLCQSTIARVERVDTPLFISPVTLEAFHTIADLESNIAAARSRLGPIRIVAPPPLPGALPPPSAPPPQYPPMPMRGPPALPPGAPPVLALPGPAVVPSGGAGGGGGVYGARPAGGFPAPPQTGGPPQPPPSQ